MSDKTLHEKLVEIQAKLKAAKNQRNNFGGYDYRSLEDIVEAVKPLLAERMLVLNMSDDIVLIGERYYLKATVCVTDGNDSITSIGYAREDSSKKGMSVDQLTGATSSYARKYAANGLFAIDDSKDSDHTNDGTDTTHKKVEVKTIKKATPPVKKVTELPKKTIEKKVVEPIKEVKKTVETIVPSNVPTVDQMKVAIKTKALAAGLEEKDFMEFVKMFNIGATPILKGFYDGLINLEDKVRNFIETK